MATFRLIKDSLQDRFLKSRAKVRLGAGGFANGKTSSACILAIELSKIYPGSNGLIARETYPKLNDTIRKEFLKWCPKDWIQSFPMSANASNTCTLKNGTMINFRYISQQGKQSNDATTSNQLSATYDWIIVDQMEDPGIVHKDFLDLLGRLRGSARLDRDVAAQGTVLGDVSTLPATGPRWLIGTTNPTRNWLYREVVKPVHDYLKNIPNPRLLCETDAHENIVLFDGKPRPIVEIFEGSTYENRDNLEPDYIKTLEATYRGQMRERYLMGGWAAYEGLVYPQFDEVIHVVSHSLVEQYYWQTRQEADQMIYVEGYDDGLAVPACYLFGFSDFKGNIILVDGFYEKEYMPEMVTGAINSIRDKYKSDHSNHVLADPDIFRRKRGEKKTVGKSVADMFLEDGIYAERGNSDIHNGIIKVSQYLNPIRMHENPFTKQTPAPHLYISDKLEFVINEFTDYYWKRDPKGEIEDVPQDKNDHAMDTIKYLLSKRPQISSVIIQRKPEEFGWRKWGERDMQESRRDVRHGR